jgi:hypothetical protein
MSKITRYQTERQFVSSGDAVRLKQLGNQGPEFMHECFQALGLGDEPWDMLAFGDPYRRLGVPRCRNREFLGHVDQTPFSAAIGAAYVVTSAHLRATHRPRPSTFSCPI